MKKYYADLNLYFDKRKYSIVGPTDGKKKEILDCIETFARDHNLTCDLKTKKFFSDNKEVGSFSVTSQTIN